MSLWYSMQGECRRRLAAECSKKRVLWGLDPTKWTYVHTRVFLCKHACHVHEVWQSCATKVWVRSCYICGCTGVAREY